MEFLLNLVYAFIGGVILNFMPCVFPVLSLKAAAIINGFSSSLKLKLNGIAYTLGVLATILLVSLALLALRHHIYDLMNLSFQLESPVLILILLYIMFAIGLCFCGLFDIPLIFSRSDKASSSFLGGILLTLVAIPCITLFMAPAIGFALIQSSILVSISVFLFLGLGIALPYFVVSFFPSALEFLPEPDEWTAALKHFPLFSISLSIIWLFLMLTKEIKTISLLTSLLSSTFSVWIWIFNNNVKPLIKPVISILFFRLITYRSSYPKQQKRLPCFKTTFKYKKIFSNLKLRK